MSEDRNVCPVCGELQADRKAALRHAQFEHGTARESDGAGGTVEDGRRTEGDSGGGRVQTE